MNKKTLYNLLQFSIAEEIGEDIAHSEPIKSAIKDLVATIMEELTGTESEEEDIVDYYPDMDDFSVED